MSGVERIARERQRQMGAEGWSADHDDSHDRGELLAAAALYVEAAQIVERAPDQQAAVRRAIERHGLDPDVDEDYLRMVENPARHFYGWFKVPRDWPWSDGWKPSPNATRNLEKAGALIAAEIDRLERAEGAL